MDRTHSTYAPREHLPRQRRRLRTTSITATLLVALIAAPALGCATEGGNDASGSATDARSVAAPDLDGAASGAADEATPAAADERSADVAPAVDAVDDGSPTDTSATGSREVILDGRISIEVGDLDKTLDRAEQAAGDAGGFLSDEQVDNSSGSNPTATAVYRVPPAAFRSVLGSIAELGDVQSQEVGSQDVTAEVADLDSRMATLATSIERLRGFLGAATDANQIALLEGELTRREAEAASIAAQRRAIGERVELATITVAFLSGAGAPPVEPSPAGFAGGLGAGLDAATSVARGMLAAVGFLVPFLPFALALGLAVVWLRRRRLHSGIAPDQPAVS